MTDSFESAQLEMSRQLRSLRSVEKSAEGQAFAAWALADNERLSAAEQLEIYREQFWLRHTASLLEDFPGVSGILGQKDWESLVESYLVQQPPSAWSLRDLGQHFKAHLTSRPETPHHPLCVDMASLEWAYIEIFDAAEGGALSADKLRAIPEEAWQTARIMLSQALRLLDLRYPVAELRRALRAAATQPGSAAVPIPSEERCYYLLYRGTDRGLYFERLSAAAFEILVRLQRGAGLVPACEDVVQHWPEFETEIEAKLFTWFANWGQRGIVLDVEVGDDAPTSTR